MLKPWETDTHVERVEQAIFLVILNICVALVVSKKLLYPQDPWVKPSDKFTSTPCTGKF